jgi:hypothetical protein
MFTVEEFKDGYYSIGFEGERRCFVPNFKIALDIIQRHYHKKIQLTSEVYIRKVDATLQEEFRQ